LNIVTEHALNLLDKSNEKECLSEKKVTVLIRISYKIQMIDLINSPVFSISIN
jgi:hypothetical protein